MNVADPVWKNLAVYFSSLWNWIDVVAIVLFLPGMVIRWSFYDGHNPGTPSTSPLPTVS